MCESGLLANLRRQLAGLLLRHLQGCNTWLICGGQRNRRASHNPADGKEEGGRAEGEESVVQIG